MSAPTPQATRRSTAWTVIVALVIVLPWLFAALVQTALAWGFVGLEKPAWFIALSFAVWVGAPIGLVGFAVVAMGRGLSRRDRRVDR
ncbi:MAG: hypothetical protein ACHREM_16780 [Polyangiales bacterium]